MKINSKVQVKVSRYNMTVRELSGSILLFNTLQDSPTLVRKDLPYNKMGRNSLDLLHRQGILINQDMEESQIIRHRANFQKYCGKRLHIFLTLTGACNCNCGYCFAKGC